MKSLTFLFLPNRNLMGDSGWTDVLREDLVPAIKYWRITITALLMLTLLADSILEIRRAYLHTRKKS